MRRITTMVAVGMLVAVAGFAEVQTFGGFADPAEIDLRNVWVIRDRYQHPPWSVQRPAGPQKASISIDALSALVVTLEEIAIKPTGDVQDADAAFYEVVASFTFTPLAAESEEEPREFLTVRVFLETDDLGEVVGSAWSLLEGFFFSWGDEWN